MTNRDIRLTPTSYIVLGLINAAGRATPYDLKQMHAAGIGGFWTLNLDTLIVSAVEQPKLVSVQRENLRRYLM